MSVMKTLMDVIMSVLTPLDLTGVLVDLVTELHQIGTPALV